MSHQQISFHLSQCIHDYTTPMIRSDVPPLKLSKLSTQLPEMIANAGSLLLLQLKRLDPGNVDFLKMNTDQ